MGDVSWYLASSFTFNGKSRSSFDKRSNIGILGQRCWTVKARIMRVVAESNRYTAFNKQSFETFWAYPEFQSLSSRLEILLRLSEVIDNNHRQRDLQGGNSTLVLILACLSTDVAHIWHICLLLPPFQIRPSFVTLNSSRNVNILWGCVAPAKLDRDHDKIERYFCVYVLTEPHQMYLKFHPYHLNGWLEFSTWSVNRRQPASARAPDFCLRRGLR